MDNQMLQTLNHLQAHETITSMEAFQLYGITRLADKVLKLRQKGYKISTIMTDGVNRYGRHVRYATYKLVEDNECDRHI